MPHLIIPYITISISHFYRGLIVHVVKMLVSNLLAISIITRSDPGGDWVKTFYTMLSILLLLRVVLIKYYVNSPYDFPRYSYSMIC